MSKNFPHKLLLSILKVKGVSDGVAAAANFEIGRHEV